MDEIVLIVCYAIVTILIFVGIIVIVKKNGTQEPIDDSQWNFDMGNIKARLRKFISGNEEILAILGIDNITELMTKGIDKNGFCILTEKAFYFIGKLSHQKGIFTTKNDTQRRINMESYRAINAKKKIEPKLLAVSLIAPLVE